jgi:hypothetical protein
MIMSHSSIVIGVVLRHKVVCVLMFMRKFKSVPLGLSALSQVISVVSTDRANAIRQDMIPDMQIHIYLTNVVIGTQHR